MAEFDDMDDPALAAACNRLAAFCEGLPAGAVVDAETALGEPDLVLVLRRLFATRNVHMKPVLTTEQVIERYGRSSVPLTRG